MISWFVRKWNLFWLRRDTEQKRLLRDIGSWLPPEGSEHGKDWMYRSILQRLRDGGWVPPREEKLI